MSGRTTTSTMGYVIFHTFSLLSPLSSLQSSFFNLGILLLIPLQGLQVRIRHYTGSLRESSEDPLQVS